MKLWREEKGQSLLEFALVLPILLLLISGILDLGRIMYAYLNLNMAAEEAVRLGGLGKTDAEITQFAQNYVHIGSSPVTVTITPDQTIRKSGDYVTVKLSYNLPYLTPIISNILPPPDLIVDSTIRVE
ncbi:MAG: pilus assembly protein TadE [Paenibacillus sp. RIFOXYA1_FULL_44_5]|nr:MAG: pilus assembly protein TadE [Paenibacillus sp. RIFOXYA1_FULL_44_5]